MRLEKLLANIKGVELHGTPDVEISSLSCDSRQVKPGAIFAALPPVSDAAGPAVPKINGEDYIPQAIKNGAVAIIARRFIKDLEVPLVVVPDARAAISIIAESFYGHPSKKLKLIGVTGTNGKTTTVSIIQHILASVGNKCGMLGTIGNDFGEGADASQLTTPGPVEFSQFLSKMVDNSCSHAVAEVSSHALIQKRTAGAKFSAAVFTNLTRDHLDYHGNMEEYAKAKSLLFSGVEPGAPVILNADDPWAEKFSEISSGENFHYGIEKPGDLNAIINNMGLDGTEIQLIEGNDKRNLKLELIGRHNIYNILAAALTCRRLDVPLEDVAAGLESFVGVPGRLERIATPVGGYVFVDYAHTDDALRNVLKVLRPLTARKLVVVFGCGGDRDRGKRPVMAKIAEELADQVIVTNDNPRTEEQEQIFTDIRAGFTNPDAVFFQPDRKEAVSNSVRTIGKGDTLLVAGKGHEDYQIIGKEKIHLDDREIVRNAIAENG